MSELLYLYKELTKMARANELRDDSLKFSVTINGEYGQMIEELANRTNTTRAELARHLICTALDEIDSVYNLKNDDDFDYEVTAEVEKDLAELAETRAIDAYVREVNRVSELKNMIENFDDIFQQMDSEMKKNIFNSLQKELAELEGANN